MSLSHGQIGIVTPPPKGAHSASASVHPQQISRGFCQWRSQSELRGRAGASQGQAGSLTPRTWSSLYGGFNWSMQRGGGPMTSWLKSMLTDFGQALYHCHLKHTVSIPAPQSHGPALMLLIAINFVHPSHSPARAFPSHRLPL